MRASLRGSPQRDNGASNAVTLGSRESQKLSWPYFMIPERRTAMFLVEVQFHCRCGYTAMGSTAASTSSSQVNASDVRSD
jgi:hypothetical protein